jgi:hypothetical protein
MGLDFVGVETDTLPLSDGAWIIVRRRLNHGEQTDMFARLYIAGVDGQFRSNPFKQGMATVTAYLLDWSRTDQPIRGLTPEQLEPILRGLAVESFAEIRKAVEAHELTQEKAREVAKNGTGGAIESSAISSSPVAVAGDIQTSVN